jgi:hypothetical protein
MGCSRFVGRKTVLEELEDPVEIAEGMTGAHALHAENVSVMNKAWYRDASGAFTSLLIGSETGRIAQYAAEVEARAHALEGLWLQEPFRKDTFLEEAAAIVGLSDEIEENVATLKNTVVRFMRARNPDPVLRKRGLHKRRRMGRHGQGMYPVPASAPDAGGSQ